MSFWTNHLVLCTFVYRLLDTSVTKYAKLCELKSCFPHIKDVIPHILGLTAPRDAALTVPLVVPKIPESVIVV